MIFCFLIITLFELRADYSEKDEIIWLGFDLPPAWIVAGEYANNGIVDIQTEIFKKNLPEYKHTVKSVPWSRFQNMIESKERIYACASYINIDTKNPNLFYSIPHHFTTPKTIIFDIKKKDEFGRKTVLNFEELIQNKSFKFGYDEGRPYTAKLDKIIPKYKEQSNIIKFYSSQADTITMMLMGRIDYIVEFSDIFTYKLGLKKISSHNFYSFIIEEEGPMGLLGNIVAVKTGKGKEFIKKANAMIKKIRGTEEFLNTYLGSKWTPKEMIPIRRMGLNDLLSGKYDHKASKLDN